MKSFKIKYPIVLLMAGALFLTSCDKDDEDPLTPVPATYKILENDHIKKTHSMKTTILFRNFTRNIKCTKHTLYQCYGTEIQCF